MPGYIAIVMLLISSGCLNEGYYLTTRCQRFCFSFDKNDHSKIVVGIVDIEKMSCTCVIKDG